MNHEGIVGSPTGCQEFNKEIFEKVARRYALIGEQAVTAAANSIYKTRNITRSATGTDFLADVERATKRVLSPALWSVFCDICLNEAGRPHTKVSAIDYATVVELAGAEYRRVGLVPSIYFARIRQRSAA